MKIQPKKLLTNTFYVFGMSTAIAQSIVPPAFANKSSEKMQRPIEPLTAEQFKQQAQGIQQYAFVVTIIRASGEVIKVADVSDNLDSCNTKLAEVQSRADNRWDQGQSVTFTDLSAQQSIEVPAISRNRVSFSECGAFVETTEI